MARLKRNGVRQCPAVKFVSPATRGRHRISATLGGLYDAGVGIETICRSPSRPCPVWLGPCEAVHGASGARVSFRRRLSDIRWSGYCGRRPPPMASRSTRPGPTVYQRRVVAPTSTGLRGSSVRGRRSERPAGACRRAWRNRNAAHGNRVPDASVDLASVDARPEPDMRRQICEEL